MQGNKHYISYHSSDLLRYEETAFRVLVPLIESHQSTFCYDPESSIWEEFYERFGKEFSKDHPNLSYLLSMVRKDNWKALGLNTFATKRLQTNRERRDWQYKIWGKLDRPVDMLEIVITEKFPELIEDLDKTVTPYFLNYKKLKREAEEEREKICSKIHEEVKEALIAENGGAFPLNTYYDDFPSRVDTELKKRFGDKGKEYKERCQVLYNEYGVQLNNWFCKHNICDEHKNPPKFIIDKFHKLICESYVQREYNAKTNILGWCSKYGTHSLSEYLGRSNSNSGWWVWPMTNDMVTFLHFKPEDFEFKYPAWLPDIPPYLSEAEYKNQLKTHFDEQLETYLSKIREELKTYEIKTSSSPAKLEEHIEWLIHRVSFNEKYEYLAEIFKKKSTSTITDGIDHAAAALNIHIP